MLTLIQPPKAGTESLYLSNIGEDQPSLGRIAAEQLIAAFKSSGREGGNVAAIQGPSRKELDRFASTPSRRRSRPIPRSSSSQSRTQNGILPEAGRLQASFWRALPVKAAFSPFTAWLITWLRA